MALTVRQALMHSGLVPVDAQVLMAHALSRDRAWLAAHATDALPRSCADTFFVLAKRRRDGEPVAYLTGTREFRGLALAVTPDVLIPRPETETLVESALDHLPRGTPLRMLDLGTGSGAIALAVARERPDARILATDRSAAALAVARGNAGRAGVDNVRFVLADWYDGIAGDDGPFDVIVSNPPYVAIGDAHLTQGDLRFEPIDALAAGRDGLDALRRVIGGARGWLVDGGTLIVEHGYDQRDAVGDLIREAGFSAVESRRDLSGIPRVCIAR